MNAVARTPVDATRTPAQEQAVDEAIQTLDALLQLRRKNPEGFPRAEAVIAIMRASIVIDRNTADPWLDA